MDPLGHRGRHTALEQDHEQQILDWIKQNIEASRVVTRKEIKDYDASQFQVPITRGCVNSFILCYPELSFKKKVPPRRAAFATTASVPRTNSAESQ
jgi:transposase